MTGKMYNYVRFENVPDCYAEYTDPANRRFHQSQFPSNCGPQVELLNEKGCPEASNMKQ
jgi:hydrogenase maturation factor HypF (carbamoyltransferase family)